MKLIQFYENNSGGGRWLTDIQWRDLEKEGWQLLEYNCFVFDGPDYAYDSEGKLKLKGKVTAPEYAFKKFNSINDAIEEWERITGANSEEVGCDCCGRPYNFEEV